MADIDRLTVIWDADFQRMDDKLNKVIRSNYGAAAKIEKSWANSSNVITATFGRAVEDVTGKAASLPGVFGNLGAALSKLGPQGLATAAALVAVAAGMGEAVSAAEYAKTLTATAAQLHVTTTALQEYEQANRMAGGTVEGADSALHDFSVHLGEASAGMPRALRAFRELFGNGFTVEDIKKLGDVDSALKAVTARIDALKSPSQKIAIIEQLGLTGLAPAINKGLKGMQDLRDEAQKIGIVMDSDLVRKGADAKDKMETLSKVIDIQLKTAFVEAAPAIKDLMQLVAGLITLLAKGEQGWVKLFKNSTSTDHAIVVADAAKKQNENEIARLRTGPQTPATAARIARLNTLNAGLDNALHRAMSDNAAASETPPAAAGTGNLANVSKSSGPSAADQAKAYAAALKSEQDRQLTAESGLTDDIVEQARLASAKLDADHTAYETQVANDKNIAADRKGELIAQDAITTNLEKTLVARNLARAKAEKQIQILDDLTGAMLGLLSVQDNERKTAEEKLALGLRQLELQHQQIVRDYDNDVVQGKKSALEVAILKSIEERAYQQRRENETADAAQAETDRKLQLEKDATDGLVALLSIQEAMATTAAERRAVQLRILDAEHQIELKTIAAAQAKDPAGFTNHAQDYADQVSKSNTLYNARKGQIDFNNAGPIQQYIRSLSDLDTAFQDVASHGLQTLTDGIVDAITHAKTLGQAFHDVAGQIIADLIRIEVERNITLPLANALDGLFTGGNPLSGALSFLPTGGGSQLSYSRPGRAAGGPVAGGQAYMVGEMGPEMFVPKTPGTIVPNHSLGAAGGPVIQIDARGALLTPDFWAMIEHRAQVAEVRGASMAAASMSRQAGLRLG